MVSDMFIYMLSRFLKENKDIVKQSKGFRVFLSNGKLVLSETPISGDVLGKFYYEGGIAVFLSYVKGIPDLYFELDK